MLKKFILLSIAFISINNLLAIETEPSNQTLDIITLKFQEAQRRYDELTPEQKEELNKEYCIGEMELFEYNRRADDLSKPKMPRELFQKLFIAVKMLPKEESEYLYKLLIETEKSQEYLKLTSNSNYSQK